MYLRLFFSNAVIKFPGIGIVLTQSSWYTAHHGREVMWSGV